MAAAAVALACEVRAQRPVETLAIGFLSANARDAMAARVESFRQGLRERGYVEGENVRVLYRFAEGRVDGLRTLADDLVRLEVKAIVTEGTTATRAAREATSIVPIVMAQDPDPVGTGLVASLAPPGGNVTGLSNLRPDLGAKRLELLKEIVPGLARVAVLGTSTTPGTDLTLRETERAARAFAIEIRFLEISNPAEIEAAFTSARDGRADAVLLSASPFLLSNRSQVADFALKNRLPVMSYTMEFVRDGGLVSYGVNTTDLFKRAASFVDRILKGADPAGLPIEQPTKFEFVINLKSARSLGLDIPQTILYRADQVIE
jgi:putative ABC transport system substrate-binding protein